MKLGLIIVNYNDSETTIKLIKNIKNYSIIDEIVIVDNNSTDNSLKLLEKYKDDKTTVLKNSSNFGYSSGINFGSQYLIKKLKNCNIIISNPDIEIPSENVLKELVYHMNNDNSIGIIAPIIKEHTGFNRGWKIPTPFIDSLLNIPFFHRYLRKIFLYYNENHYNKEKVEVEAVSGCFFMINSNILKRVNYFDENVFLYYEENIISKKLQQINKKVFILTNVEVFHNHSVSIDKNINSINKCRQQKKSQMYFHINYNNASLIEQTLLRFTQFLSISSSKILSAINRK